jgi:exonuclease III
MGYLNIRYLQNKMDEIPYILSKANDKFHMFCIAETHLDKELEYPELAVSGYERINKPPTKSLETGLLLYYTPNLHVKQLDSYENLGVECIWIEITFKKSKPIRVGFLYRNPAENADWYKRFGSMMEAVSHDGNEIMLFGDLNIDVLKSHTTWKKTYQQFNLVQTIKRPTRLAKKTETLIDHIYTTDKANVIEATSSHFGPSDHNAICATWSKKNIKIPKVGHTIIQIRNMKKFDANNFLTDLHRSNLSSNTQSQMTLFLFG